MKVFCKAFLAGIMIAIGGTIYLMCPNKVIGATLFGIGLFTIVVYKLNLYTGKIGYVITKEIKIRDLLITLLGNLAGTCVIGYLLCLTRICDTIKMTALNIVNLKLDDQMISIFILSMMCGLLMYLAVNGYKKIEDSLGKNLAVFLSVIVFILAGFEHCIANMYYFAVANTWTLHSLLYLLIMIIGNSLGAFIFPLLNKIIKED